MLLRCWERVGDAEIEVIEKGCRMRIMQGEGWGTRGGNGKLSCPCLFMVMPIEGSGTGAEKGRKEIREVGN